MTDPAFGAMGDESSDDLPRTFRREKEARAREAREKAEKERAAAPSLSTAASYAMPAGPSLDSGGAMPAVIDTYESSVTVGRLEMPFFHLAWFLCKAVVAGIPALLLLLTILWGIGHVLQMAFPELIKMKILISFPN